MHHAAYKFSNSVRDISASGEHLSVFFGQIVLRMREKNTFGRNCDVYLVGAVAERCLVKKDSSGNSRLSIHLGRPKKVNKTKIALSRKTPENNQKVCEITPVG